MVLLVFRTRFISVRKLLCLCFINLITSSVCQISLLVSAYLTVKDSDVVCLFNGCCFKVFEMVTYILYRF